MGIIFRWLAIYIAICFVLGFIIESAQMMYYRWRIGSKRKRLFALIRQNRTQNNAARAQRHELKSIQADIQILKQQRAQRLLEEVAAPCDSFDSP
jgi:hypothetical protein